MYNIDKKEIIRTFKLFYTGGSSMKKIRNILAMLMVFVMLVAVMPMNVFATDSPTEPGAGQPAAGAEETELQKAQKDAKKTVNDLKNISDTDRQTALGAIETATNKGEVDTAVNKAKEADKEALDKAKKDAKDEVDKLSDLSQANKDAAKQAITDAQDKNAVATELGKAQALNNEKGKEKDEVKDLANKEAALQAIEAANTVDDVKAAVTKAKEDAKKAAEEKEKEEKKEEEKKALAKAKTDAKAEVDKLDKLSKEDQDKFKDKIDKADKKDDVEKILKEAKEKANPKPAPKTGTYTIDTGYTTYGNIEVNKRTADANDEITVTVKPKYGYVVSRVYFMVNGTSVEQTINNYYNSYYYDRYPGYYYGDSYYDYFSYYSEYRNSKYYYNHYSNYHEFLRYEHRSHYLNYKNWDDRYDDDDYYYNWYYYKRNGYRPWYYGRVYDNSLYNTSDKFTMPSGNVTVYVEFTDWSYYGYYYDDYYYYRNKKDNYYERQKKAEAAKKEEEEAKAKAEAEKLPQVYENKAVIAIGSNVLDKVSKNVHTVHEMDTPAYVNNGRVMLPLRYVAEALGLQVSWVPETKTVIIWDLTQRVEIPVKSNRIIVNGITYTSDVKPEIKSSRTMLPIANIARALGLIDGSDIIWDQYNKQVTLTRKVLSK